MNVVINPKGAKTMRKESGCIPFLNSQSTIKAMQLPPTLPIKTRIPSENDLILVDTNSVIYV